MCMCVYIHGGGVMVSVLASGAVDGGFEPRSTTAKKVYMHIQIYLIMEPCRKHIYLIERYHCTY
jgi:hypothetical protein